jgi:hypothetical protein
VVTFRAPDGVVPRPPGALVLPGGLLGNLVAIAQRGWAIARSHLSLLLPGNEPEDWISDAQKRQEYVNARELSRKAWLFLFPLGYVAFDELETLFTFWAMGCGLGGSGCDFGIDPWQARVIHALSDLKWLALVANLVLLVILFRWRTSEGAWSWRRSRLTRLARNRMDLAVGPPAGVVVAVLLLAVLVAVPGGGALDQMPDVLRAELDDLLSGEVGRPLMSLLGLVLLLATLLVILKPTTQLRTVSTVPQGDKVVLGVGATLTLALVLLHLVLEGWNTGLIGAFAPLLLVALLLVAGWVTDLLHGQLGHQRIGASYAGAPTPAKSYDQRTRAQVAAAILLAGVVLTVGLGAARATLPLFMLTGVETSGDTYATFGSVLITLTAPAAVGTAALWFFRTALAGFGVKVALWTVVSVLNVGVAVWMAVSPEDASGWGGPATLTFALSFYVLVFGAFSGLSRSWAWGRTTQLGLGPRTPWFAVFVLVWLVMSNLAVRGYHDVRTVPVPEAASATDGGTRSAGQAFESWAAQFASGDGQSCVTTSPSSSSSGQGQAETPRKVPLVLVAAPGGGGKAAYWTAIGMDMLFSDEGFCSQSLFAASGVSGGALGLTTALALPPGQDKAGPAEASMTSEGPLSETLAAMLMRDLPQPLSTLRGRWADRASVLEDAWSNAAGSGVYTHDDDGVAVDKTMLDLGQGWWTAPDNAESHLASAGPVLLLNGTSVNDGCRTLAANVAGISSGNRGCLAGPVAATKVPPTGAVSGSVDVLHNLLPSEREDSRGDNATYCGDGSGQLPADAQTVRATTAALLAARFPFVTPSGAIDTCLMPDEAQLNRQDDAPADPLEATRGLGSPTASTSGPTTATTYVVDGGYLENTGILTLLQVWDVLKPRVLECNRSVASGVPEAGCPADSLGPILIEPWFVMLENHYRSRNPPAPSADRPRELVVPLEALGKKGTTVATTPMEQAIAVDVSGVYGSRNPDEVTLRSCNRFVRLAPLLEPEGKDEFASVEAPLGWVLADGTRAGMRTALEESWDLNSADFGTLRARCT